MARHCFCSKPGVVTMYLEGDDCTPYIVRRGATSFMGDLGADNPGTERKPVHFVAMDG